MSEEPREDDDRQQMTDEQFRAEMETIEFLNEFQRIIREINSGRES